MRRCGRVAGAVSVGMVMWLFASGAWAQAESATEKKRTLLAVFAHPDDETMVGPLLAHYGSKADTDVYLVLATGGDQGVTPFAKIPAGKKLAAVRGKEAECACQNLGIHPPIMLGLPDGGLSGFQVLGELVSKIEKVVTDVRPDAIVTWGPEGGYGHADHRLVSAAVTQIVQAGETTTLLYYAALPTKGLTSDVSSALKLPVFKPTAERFLNTRVPYSEEDEAKARAALACHESQFTPETMEQLSALGRRVNNGVMYLRSWSGGAERADLFQP